MRNEPTDDVQADIFESGTGGYHTYCIPALLVTRQRNLLAFCESRRNDSGNHGDIDLLAIRSEQNCRSWSGRAVRPASSVHPNARCCSQILKTPLNENA